MEKLYHYIYFNDNEMKKMFTALTRNKQKKLDPTVLLVNRYYFPDDKFILRNRNNERKKLQIQLVINSQYLP